MQPAPCSLANGRPSEAVHEVDLEQVERGADVVVGCGQASKVRRSEIHVIDLAALREVVAPDPFDAAGGPSGQPVGEAARAIGDLIYTIAGGLDRDVWLGKNNTLVRVAFAAKDGSHIVYQLR